MIIRVRLVPRSSRTGFVQRMDDGVMKISVKAAPVQGRANDELVKWLSREFRVGRASVEITSGRSSRTKSVKITEPLKLPDWLNG